MVESVQKVTTYSGKTGSRAEEEVYASSSRKPSSVTQYRNWIALVNFYG